MADSLTYYDALKILGAPQKSRLLTALDAVARAGLTGLAAGSVAAGRDPGPVLDLLDLTSEVTGYGQEVVRRVSEWRSGLARFDRSQRLAAAHAVLVVASYFGALDGAGLLAAGQLDLTAAEQAALAAGTAPPGGYADMIGVLLRERLPMPEPHRAYAQTREQLASFYDLLSRRVARFVSGLALWDGLDDAARRELEAALAALPASALDRYDSGYRDLAVDNREFGVWAGLAESRATAGALARMSALLGDMADGPGHRPRAVLRRSYQAVLSEPITGSGEAPEGVVLPSLDEAYVTPVCRVAEIGPGDFPAESSWWDQQDLVEDTEGFLAGYLISPRATAAPLVVLGEPGSGKSKLAQVLAARLPEDDFLPVLVELREVAAESLIQEQIEQAIYQGPGERVSWRDLTDAAGGALPVVVLDGFDELVQAAEMNRYDYLEQVRDFQGRQARAGCPVAMIVTTRTVVADQARFPPGSMALRLLPFTAGQVRQWLEVWDRHNAAGLEARGLRSLPAATALAHGELAGQPLLLLMLALFDAAANDLQHAGGPIGQAELYERLLAGFARREVSKSARSRALPTSRQRDQADRELQRLGIVALAMFARGRQSAREAELNDDLRLLFPDDHDSAGDDAGLTRAQRAVGRFFFVYKSEARYRDDRARSYEFLHATFGEFLVARLTVNALRGLAAHRRLAQREMTAADRLDDGFLFAVLSFACLAERAPITGFLRELLAALAPGERSQIRQLLAELITQSLVAHPARSLAAYEPVPHNVTRRLAAYSANLVILLVLTAGKVSAAEFSAGEDPAKSWARYGYLWRSALNTAEWNGLTETIRARVSRHDGRTEITLTPENGAPVSPASSIAITASTGALTNFVVHVSRLPGVSYDAEIPAFTEAGKVFRKIAFTPDWQMAMLLLQAIPAIRALGGDIRVQASAGTDILPGHLLALLDYGRGTPDRDRLLLYDTCLKNASDPGFLEQVLLRLNSDLTRFPAAAICRLLSCVPADSPLTSTYAQLLSMLWRESGPPTARAQVIACVRNLQRSHPGDPLLGINPDLLAAARIHEA